MIWWVISTFITIILTSCRGTEGLAGWWLGPGWTWWRCGRGPTVPASSSPCILEEVLTICSVTSLQKKKSQISPTRYWFTQRGEWRRKYQQHFLLQDKADQNICLLNLDKVATCAQCRFLIYYLAWKNALYYYYLSDVFIFWHTPLV